MDWARVHGVRPPDFAIAEAKQARIDVAWLVQPAGGAACCAKALVAESRSCCHAKHGCCGDHHDDAQPATSQNSHVIGWKALNCQGHSADWVAAVPTLIPNRCGQQDQLVRVEWLGPTLSECANRAVDLPAIPPPEAV